MSKALLTYVINDDQNIKRSVTLESGTLYYVDVCTKQFANSLELKKNPNYKDRINKLEQENNTVGKLQVEYVKNNENKEKLPLLLNDNKAIFLRDDFYNNNTSEIEKARHYLFNSKNKMFLKSFLKCKKLYNTFNFYIEINLREYKDALKKNIECMSEDGMYYINSIDLLKYVSNHKKLGLIRPIFEDALEMWKDKMKKKSDEARYYYSRNFRILINEYNKKINNNSKTISNLSFNEKKILDIYDANKDINQFISKKNNYKIKILNKKYV